MKNCKQLPGNWVIAPIEELLEPLANKKIINQGWSPRCEKEPSNSEKEWGALKTTAIQPGAFLPEYNKKLPVTLEPRPQLEVQAGDLLLTCAGPRNRCGIACLVRSTRKHLMISGKMYRFRPKSELLDAKFLEFYLQTLEAQEAIDKMKTGGNESGLNLTHSRFRKLLIPFPPINQQKYIVAEIEKQFSRLDEAVANLKRAKANLKRYKAAVLKAAVEGKLTEEDSSNWESVLLGKIATTIRNGYSKKPDAESGTRIFRISAVRPLVLHLDDVRYLSGSIEDYSKHVVTEGNVLFTRYNGNPEFVGVCAAVPKKCAATVHPDKLIRVSVPREILLPEMLVFLASAGAGRDYIRSKVRTTAGQSGISGGDLKTLPLRIPPLAVQQKIIVEVARCLSIVTGTEMQIDRNLRRADRLRQSILKKAFSGKLVSNQ